jgi:hypothetical protein
LSWLILSVETLLCPDFSPVAVVLPTELFPDFKFLILLSRWLDMRTKVPPICLDSSDSTDLSSFLLLLEHPPASPPLDPFVSVDPLLDGENILDEFPMAAVFTDVFL